MTGRDGVAGAYSYLAAATSPDARTGPGASIDAPGPDSIYPSRVTARRLGALARKLPADLAAKIKRGLRAGTPDTSP
jgi:hypothetical protein